MSSPRQPIQDVDILMRGHDPARGWTLRAESVDGALDELGAAIVARPRPPRVRRRWVLRPRTLVFVGAVLFVMGATVAVGSVLTAHTGRYPTPAEEALGGPGEALDPAAPDFRQVALQVASDIPYPTRYESWRDFLISDEIRSAGGNGLESTGALHGWFAASAYCAWVRTWREAEVGGDAAAAASASQVIAAAPGWKAVTDEDPHPDASVPGDDGSIQYSLFGWMLPYRQAVLDGDSGEVDHLLATGYGDKCWTSDPDWRAELAAHPEWGTYSRAQMAQEYERFLTSGRS